MPNTALTITSNTTGVASTANTTQFWPFNACLVVSSTETQMQETTRTPGWFKSLTCILSANAVAATSTFRFRKNAANGNQLVSVGSSATGTFQDLTNQDHVAAGDKICFTTVPGATTNTYTLTFICALFDSDQNFVTRLATSTSLAYTTGGNFNNIAGRMGAASSEAGIKARQRKPGNIRNMQVNLSANAKTSTMTYNGRKNGANGALTISIGIGASGIIEDNFATTGHSDTIAVGDDWNGAFAVGTDTTNAATFQVISQDFQTTVGNFFQLSAGADADVAGTVSVTRFMALGGNFVFQTTEAPCQTKALGSFTFSEMTVQQTQTSTAGVTVRFRKNTANGNQVISIAGGVTGAFSSAATLTDVVFPGDLIAASFVFGATTAGSFSKISVWGYSYNPQSFSVNPSRALKSAQQSPVFG